MTVHDRIGAFDRFWRGDGPSLILIPPGEQELYDCADYPTRFEDPEAMWESEMARARPVADWPTDGIPTVRPNLGVIFIPATVGLPYQLKPDQMPWPGEPLGREAIRAARAVAVADSHVMQLAADFYAIHRERAGGTVAAYQADTQGVFDIAHLLYGEEIFYAIADHPGGRNEVSVAPTPARPRGSPSCSRSASTSTSASRATSRPCSARSPPD